MKELGLTKKDSLCLKGIAIIMLLFYHLYREEFLYEKYDVNFFPFTENLAISIIIMFKICVSIFAFISGYGLLISIKGKKLERIDVAKWNITRLLKTMSGFYFVYIVVFIVTMLLNRLPIKVYFSEATTAAPLYALIDFLGLSNLFATPSLITAWWYMSAAIVFILLVPVVYLLSKKVGYFPIIFLFIILPRLLHTGYPGGINPYPFILPMIFGMIFADYKLFEKISAFLEKSKIIYVATFFVMIIALAYYILFYNNVSEIAQWEFKYGIFPIIVICFLRYFVIRIPGIKSILAFLGVYSMNIFLVHNFMRHIYLKDFLFSFKNFIVIFLVLLVLSLIIAIIIEWVKKLIKYDRFIDKIISVSVKQIDKFGN